MGRNASRALISLCMVGWLIVFGPGAQLTRAMAAVSDLFAALRVTQVVTGSPIASFDLKNLNGETVRSKELAGKVVLLNFWATWCGPCKEEMPSLARLQAKFDPAQFQVVTITTDIHPQGIQQFLDHLGIHLPVLFDESEDVSRSFMVRGLPTTFLITQDGHAIGRAVGPRSWDSEESVALVRHVLEGMK